MQRRQTALGRTPLKRFFLGARRLTAGTNIITV
jgi:hypothetical protein